MACPDVLTGQRFVAQSLAHIDCQAQAIGAYGYGALIDPNSTVALALTALFTVFVAIFGLRLMSGEQISGRDLVGDALRVAIVLTLATSWPAWRTLGYDLVMKGPAEIAGIVGSASDLPGSRGDMAARLQAADDGIVLLTVYGTGRNTGGTNRSDTIGDSFRGVAIADQEGLASGRTAFLTGLLGPTAIVRPTACARTADGRAAAVCWNARPVLRLAPRARNFGAGGLGAGGGLRGRASCARTVDP
jgi:type IV secretion system protein VirB6